jgi:hypothetical protein
MVVEIMKVIHYIAWILSVWDYMCRITHQKQTVSKGKSTLGYNSDRYRQDQRPQLFTSSPFPPPPSHLLSSLL